MIQWTKICFQVAKKIPHRVLLLKAPAYLSTSTTYFTTQTQKIKPFDQSSKSVSEKCGSVRNVHRNLITDTQAMTWHGMRFTDKITFFGQKY